MDIHMTTHQHLHRTVEKSQNLYIYNLTLPAIQHLYTLLLIST